MKAIMSFWSEPMLNRPNFILSNDHIANNYACWCLSVATAKQHYSSLTLFTDKLGYDILINKLKLPFDNVEVVLDEALAYVSNRFWCAGKLVAQALTKAPYVHIDSDHFTLSKPDLDFKDVLGFSTHTFPVTTFYISAINYLKTLNFKFTPLEMQDIENCTDLFSVNCGLIGFQDNKIKDAYLELAWDFLNRLQGHPEFIYYAEGKTNDFNCLIEQWTLGMMIKAYSLDLKLATKSSNRQSQTRAKLFHAWGMSKHQDNVQKFIRDLLVKNFPKYYMNFKLQAKE